MFVGFICSHANVSIHLQTDTISLENRLFKKEISFSTVEDDRIHISSIFDKTNGRELITRHQPKPLFECVINNKKVTAHDNIWRFQQHTIRDMDNGGREVKLVFNVQSPPLRGLKIILYQQIFPHTTLMREKLVLRTRPDRQFSLNKLNDKLYFKFPQYSIRVSEPVQSTEIRIASWSGELIDYDPAKAYTQRNSDTNLARNHMFHPKIIKTRLQSSQTRVSKGPFNMISSDMGQWFTAYEHASQDSRKGIEPSTWNFPDLKNDLHFLGIAQHVHSARVDVSVDILRGGYLDGEVFSNQSPYESVWTATAFSPDTLFKSMQKMIHHYLMNCICENPASRKPIFYYNTWGMQRDLQKEGHDVRGVFTEDRIKQEIQYAAQLGVDLFVLDDGWEQAQGVWTPHRERLPNGLTPLKKELDRHDMILGVWLSPMGIDKNTERFKQHPDWVITDSEGKPIKAQWGHPAFDFVSGFYELFVQDCKKLIDQGVRFFKWDAINTFYSTLPNLDHGSDRYSRLERMQRYEYLLPLYVARAMKELTDYEPDLVIEIDLTEARRAMVGLAPLQYGKYFWMNNGASWYGDYSHYRTKSMRTIPNLFAGIIPLELFTYATYPHNAAPFHAQHFNVNTSLIAGHGFWGNLDAMTLKQRTWVGHHVAKSKRVLNYITNTLPVIKGRVGASPEIYTQVNDNQAAGQVIAFSGQACKYEHIVNLNPNQLLAVLNHAFTFEDNKLILPFEFSMPDATREAFLIPNQGSGISIVSSTSWLDDVRLMGENNLSYKVGAPGSQIVHWQKRKDKPMIESDQDISYDISEMETGIEIRIQVHTPGTWVKMY
jgi:hypothetical protein